MTQEQARSIREHLISQLETTGYGDIAREVYTRLSENSTGEEQLGDEVTILNFYLSQSIDVLRTLSNENYSTLLGKFNRNLTDSVISQIEVELINQNEAQTFDLINLPDYTPLIQQLEQIQQDISNL